MMPQCKRRGVIMVLVIGILIFTVIIFASMINRLRQETQLTVRNSINESSYQLASAIGRIVVRKLQRDIETFDKQSNTDISKAMFEGKSLAPKDCTSEVENLDVILDLKSRNQNARGALDFKVFYSVDVDDTEGGSQFPADIKQLAVCDLEKRGFLTVKVVLNFAGVQKKCVIKRQFLLTRLFAPPFHKFTLFSPRGADTSAKEVNRLANIQSVPPDQIKYADPKPPLVLFNRRIKSSAPAQQGLDFRTLQKHGGSSSSGDRIIVDENTLIHNGWVFLGGTGDGHDRQGNRGLILNVCAGSNEPITQGFFGEYFHFFYSDESNGWVIPEKWNDWLNGDETKMPGNRANPKLSITYVDFGHINRTGFKFPPNTGVPLFEPTIDAYKKFIPIEELANGSAMHLFGTSSLCTPTLVFGAVKRRYLRLHSFLFNCKDASGKEVNRTYPIRGIGRPAPDNHEWDNFPAELRDYLGGRGVQDSEFLTNLANLFTDPLTHSPSHLTHEIYAKGDAERNPLQPVYIESEPYLACLKNIAKPEDQDEPSVSWNAAFPGAKYIDNPSGKWSNFRPTNKYYFQNDSQIHFTGCLENIVLPDNYLSQKTSFLIDDGPTTGGAGSSIKLSQAGSPFMRFLKTKKVLIPKTDPQEVYLNQIIRVKNDLIIDKPLKVMKGGIIMCDGEITIKAPIINAWLHETPTIADAYGFLTLISKKGITIDLPANSNPGLFKYPQVEAFLMCMNGGSGEIKNPSGNPVHIVGGVAADRIADLVKSGGIIEWGFEPGELDDGKDLTEPSFFGLALGPRDIEVVVEDHERY